MINTIQKVKERGQKVLNEIEAKEVLKDAGIPVVETLLATNEQEALKISAQLGYPIALKICSNDIIHKTEANGIALNLANDKDVSDAYNQIIASAKARFPDASIEGVAVQKMVPGGVEVIAGMTRDPQFGPMIMFGLGGIFVEILKDVSFRIVPLEKADVLEMISEIKGRPLLEGARGAEPVNMDSIVDTLLKLSDLVENNPDIAELDMNPMFASSQGVIAVDARIILV